MVRRSGQVVLAAVLAMVVGAVPAGAAAADAAALECRFVVLSSWSTGFSADLQITNRSGVDVVGWTAGWSHTSPTRLASAWSAVMRQPTADTMEARNLSYNARIPDGRTITFGWTAFATTTEIPTDIRVNGAPC